jgi:rhamnulokinase
MHSHLAIDLGAESGRVVRGSFDEGQIILEEVARFPTRMVPILGHRYWNLTRLYEAMLDALQRCAELRVDSLGVDSWGVDYVLLGADGIMSGLPYAYRDARTEGVLEELLRIVPAEELFGRTGIQFLTFNTIVQLYSMVRDRSPQLAGARSLLMVADYFHYLFTGQSRTEVTNASTTQCVDVHRGQWDLELMRRLEIPAHLFQPIIGPGTEVGRLTDELSSLTGQPPLPVIAPATHDTASAVAAVPAWGEDWAYISSGTWSLMGVECRRPVTTTEALRWNFTNERGVDGTFRLLKNIVGLWFVQRLRAEIGAGCDYATLTGLADRAEGFRSLVDVDDGRFLSPRSMSEAMADYCRQTGQPIPDSPGRFVRCALDSLALQYRLVLDQLGRLTGRPIRRIHIVGGGSRNALLCQLTADACGVPVLVGPTEATALGNVVVQARALGHLNSLEAGRRMIGESFPPTRYDVRDPARFDEPLERYRGLKEGDECGLK